MAMKTPGVYIVEENAFPNSVVEVATAVPAFVGYTELADNQGKTLLNKPWRISSMAEYHRYFGSGPTPLFAIDTAENGTSDVSMKTRVDGESKTMQYKLRQTAGRYLLYYSMLHFFQNGGGPCFVVSVGAYSNDDTIDKDALTAGIDTLTKEQEPTMLLVPDAVLLGHDDGSADLADDDVKVNGECIEVQQHALDHCADKMKNRVAILDIFRGWADRHDPNGDAIDAFRNKLGINHLDFGVAYYPWVHTGITQEKDLSFENLDRDQLQGLLKLELGLPDEAPQPVENEKPEDRAARVKIGQQLDAVMEIVTDFAETADGDAGRMQLNKTLLTSSPLYTAIIQEMATKLNLIPPGAAMAGIYTMVDNSRGVWKAPANVSLNGVTAPAVNINHADQEDLNVTTLGKSINAIRSFIGEGTLVWGARTLDGNSLDWRYVNVRRTMIMLEESIRLATKAYVFEPNTANTWITIKSMIRNFLTGIWKRGGLAGAVPEDAFSVHVGLNETMTAEDILEGILRVTVLVALSHPAEFIEITFQQQLQKS